MDYVAEKKALRKRLLRRQDHKALWSQMTPLMRAAASDDVVELTKMLALGNIKSSLFVKDAKGLTAIDWARLCRNELGVALLKKAMDTSIKDARSERIASVLDTRTHLKDSNDVQQIELFTALRNRQQTEAIRILKDSTLFREEVSEVGEVFFKDAQDKDGFTPLLIAANNNLVDAAIELLDDDVNVDETNKFGHTALTAACAGGHADMVRLLLFKGANIHHKTAEGRTGLHYACLYSKARIVKSLFDFLLERFCTMRLQQQSTNVGYDSTRWAKYTVFVQEFMDVRDGVGSRAIDLVPARAADYIMSATERAIEIQKTFSRATTANNMNMNTEYDFASKAAGNDNNEDMNNNGKDNNDNNNYNEFDDQDFNGGNYSDYDDDDDDVAAARDEPGTHREEGTILCLPCGESKEGSDKGTNLVSLSAEQRMGFAPIETSQQLYSSDDNLSEGLTDDATSTDIGAFSHDTDNLHAEGLHNLADSHSVRSALSNPSEVEAIHATYDKVKERIQTWLMNAQREDELAHDVPCWLGCSEMLKTENMAVHVRNYCQFRGVECKGCRNVVLVKDMKGHRMNDCLKRRMGCPNAWRGCKEMPTFDRQEKHVRLRCNYRMFHCRLFCGREFPLCDRDSHENDHCKNRNITCDQCLQSVVSRNITIHLKQQCPEAIVKCSVSCGRKFKRKDVRDHETRDCKAECRWGCGKILGPLERKQLHEMMSCLRRPIDCRYSCGMGGVTAQHIVEHEEHQCLGRTLCCPQGCGRKILRRDLDLHIDTWSGDCPERFARCPSNYVGWNIVVLSAMQRGLVMDYRREVFSSNVDNRLECDGADLIYVKFDDRHEWLDLRRTQILGLEKLQGDGVHAGQHFSEHFECGFVKAINLNAHLMHHCKNRIVWIASAQDRAQLGATYAGQRTMFKNAAGLAMRRDEFDEFQSKQSSTVTCEYCAFDFTLKELDHHYKFDCGAFLVRCRNGCGLKIQRKLEKEHVESECPKRSVRCPLGCDDELIWAEDVDLHAAAKCANRPVKCQLGCGVEGLTFTTEIAHRTRSCVLRTIMCDCKEMMIAKDYAAHLLSDCTNKMNLCPQSCGMRMLQQDIPKHCEFDCANKIRFYESKLFCPMGCGKRLMKRHVLEHVTYYCNRRMAECPYKCGNSIQFNRLKSHIYFCIKRPICCEPGMRPCENEIYKWLYPEPDQEEARIKMHTDDDIDDDDDGDDQTSIGDDDVSRVTFDSSSQAAYDFASSPEHGLAPRNEDAVRASYPDPEADRRAREASSIYIDGGQVLLKARLRLGGCRRHGMTALMSAVRHNEYALADYMVRIVGGPTGGRDYDLENDAGDTALTLACRFGRLSMMKLLIRNNANINLETRTGRTALIEAIRSEAPFDIVVDMVDTLVQAGALVNYKTIQHRRCSLDWAKILNLAKVVRLLDLGGIVQRQTAVLFTAIACGDTEKVKEIIADGEFFNVDNEKIAYRKMEEYVEEAQQASREIKEMKGSLSMLTDRVEQQRLVVADSERDLAAADTMLQEAYDASDDLSKTITGLFSAYERKVAELNHGDMEEIPRILRPDLPTRVSLFAYGFLMSLLDVKKWPDNEYDEQSFKEWWPDVKGTLRVSNDALVRLRAYSLDKLNSDVAKPVLERTRGLYKDLCGAIKEATQLRREEQPMEGGGTITAVTTKALSGSMNTTASLSGKKPIVVVYSGKRPHDESRHTTEVIVQHTQPLLKIVDLGYNGVTIVEHDEHAKFEEDVSAGEGGYDSDGAADDDDDATIFEIPDIDWDSEADEAGGGQWIKGKWVPENRKKERWWEGRRRRPKKSAAGNSTPAATVMMESTVEAIQPTPSPAERLSASLSGDEDEDNLGDTSEMSPFVMTILFLLRAADRLAIERTRIASTKEKIVKVGQFHQEAFTRNSHEKLVLQGNSAKRGNVEGELIRKMKFVRFNLKKAKLWREKLRVARLVNEVTFSGHTAISYAASLGNFSAMELLLSHGATIGMPQILQHLNATYLQQSYRIYRLIVDIEPQDAAIDDDEIQGNATVEKEAKSMTRNFVVEQLCLLKEKRAETLQTMKYYRNKMRFPIPEAAYRGNWEIIYRIRERRLLQFNFCNQWCFPLPPPPLCRVKNEEYSRYHRYGTKLTILDCLAHGMSDLAVGSYVEKIGWISANHGKDSFGVAKDKISEFYDKELAEIKRYRDARYRIKILADERRRATESVAEMDAAIKSRDFRKCIYIAEFRSGSVDRETDDGFTALIKAAEEDPVIENFVWTVNDDGNPSLGVCYLLDRREYRPGMSVETKVGYTALNRAAMMGRGHCLQELLIRGCEIDYQNRFGRTALHYAAEIGHLECARILLERGANTQLVDKEGRTAYMLAEEMGYQSIMRQITHIANGFFGAVRQARGFVSDTVTCPVGCGQSLYPHEIDDHLLVCIARYVHCPLDCGIDRLMFKEIDYHCANECMRREVRCKDCNDLINFIDIEPHLAKYCRNRLEICPLGCGMMIQGSNMGYHKTICTWRLIACSLNCGAYTTIASSLEHVARHCENRRVVCPLNCKSFVVFRNLHLHTRDVCPMRPSPCEFCKECFPYNSWKKHVRHCDVRHELCQAGCGLTLSIADMDRHMRDECSHRFVECDLACGWKARLVDLQRHREHECLERFVSCPLKCVVDDELPLDDQVVVTMKAKVVDVHINYNCAHRAVTCSFCNKKPRAKDLSTHRKVECPDRVVNCRIPGCLKTVPLSQRFEHERKLCRFRLVLCRQGCGDEIPVIRLTHHMSHHCLNRLADCPMKCGERLRARYMSEHMKVDCVRRHALDPNKNTYGGSERQQSRSPSPAARKGRL